VPKLVTARSYDARIMSEAVTERCRGGEVVVGHTPDSGGAAGCPIGPGDCVPDLAAGG